MKPKYLLLVLLLGIFSSCLDEEMPGTGQQIPDGKAAVDLTLKGLSGSSLRSYAPSSFTAEENENRIDSLMIYVFDQASTLLEGIQVIDGTALQNGTNPNERKVTFYIDNLGTKNIVAVANGVDTLAIRPGMSYADFCKVSSRVLNEMPEAPYFMQGEKEGISAVAGHSVTADIELTRLVARVDITINANKGENVFKLLQARFKNAADRALLVPKIDAGNIVAADDAGFITTPFKDAVSETAVDPALAGADTLWHALYLYETPMDDPRKPTLVMSGTYNGKAAVYEVPFGMDIKRNYRYLVVVDSVAPTEIKSEIMVTEWAKDTIAYNPSLSNDSLKVTLDLAMSSSGIAIKKDADNDRQIDTLIVPVGSSYLYFDVDSSNVEVEVAKTKSWISDSTGAPVTKAVFKQRVKVMLEGNYTGEGNRSAKIFIRNKVKPTDAKTFVVSQEGLLQLPGWSAANLISEGKFAQPVVSDYEADTLIYRVGYTDWTNATNDSCPSGWRLPTSQELASILPVTSANGTYATVAPQNNVQEATLTGVAGATAAYQGAGNDSKIVYGVKFQNSENAMAYRWEYKGVSNKYLKITARKVDKNTPVTTVATEDYWSTGNKTDVIRYFQHAGNDVATGIYWTSGASSMLFNDISVCYNGNKATTGAVRCVKNIVKVNN